MVVLGAVGEEEGGLAHLQWTPVADRSVSHNPSIFIYWSFSSNMEAMGTRRIERSLPATQKNAWPTIILFGLEENLEAKGIINK